MALRGRHWFTFWLAAACSALWLVIWRQTDSLRTARALNEVRQQRALLEGRRGGFERRIRAATSRDFLGPRVGLRQAADSEIFYITASDSDAMRH